MTMDAYSGRTWLKELSDKWIKAGLQPTCRREGVPHDQNCKGVHWSGTSHASLARRDVLESIYKAGCSHLVYGIESFDAPILKKLGKGTTVKQNFKSLTECLDVGIIPIPNFIIGFPEETFESIRNTMDGLIRLGIYCKPHFATPYPGSEWYYTYKHDILKQYHGSLESFIEDLGDASKITAVISHNFSALELLGFQQMMVNRDRRSLDLAERHWGEAQNHMVPLAAPMESFNFISKNVRAP
jgi:anaerobic magnesium-protoporphyrin IX monomethyl ester cyclase